MRSVGPISQKKIEFPFKIAYRKKRRENRENRAFSAKNGPKIKIFQKFFLKWLKLTEIQPWSKIQLVWTIFEGFMAILRSFWGHFDPIFPNILYRQIRRRSSTDPQFRPNILKTVDASPGYIIYRWKAEKILYKIAYERKKIVKKVLTPQGLNYQKFRTLLISDDNRVRN